MKKNILLLLFLMSSLVLVSQNIKRSIDTFKNKTGAIITINKNLETPSFIKFSVNKPLLLKGKTIKQKVNNFLNENKSVYGIENTDESLKEPTVRVDNYGLKHYILKQKYKGIPVYDAQLKFHFDKNENLKSINGNIISNIEVNPVPKLNKTDASNIGLNLIKSQKINRSKKVLNIISNELYIFPKGLAQGAVTSKNLVYKVEISNNSDVREHLFIDAHTGKLIEQFTGIAHALDRVLYEKKTTDVRWKEGDAFPGFLDSWRQNEVIATGHAYYFFKNAFGYISFDNQDSQMKIIHNNPDINCPNATWNGETTNYCEGTASDDVVAHEWGHAYTQYTSNLIYQYESGALNESFSDIWGETIDILNNYEDDGENLSIRSGSMVTERWKMGEDASAFGGAIRDMWDPTLNGDPGKVTDSNYVCSSGDNGGVHTNSGIPNHTYALIVDGGTFNGQTIIGLGFTKAAHIFWRAQSEYLTQTSGFSTFADAIEASCSDLIGINLKGLSTAETNSSLSGEIITNADYNEVLKVLIAIELRSENNCSFATILTSNEDLCEASTSNPIFFEDWESGIDSDWKITQLPVNASTWESREWVLNNKLPKGREGASIYAPNLRNGDCTTDFQNGIIRLESPNITIPNYTQGKFELAFTHNIASESEYDGGNLKFSINNGATWAIIPASAFSVNPYNNTLTTDNNNDNPMVTEAVFSGTDENSEDSIWGQSVIDLTELGVNPNSNLLLRWEFGSDGCGGVDGWYVDDIIIYNCSESSLSVNNYNFLNDNISISNNPSSGLFNIKTSANISNINYKVYDITGKVLVNKKNIIKNSFEVNLKNYTKGVYFLKLYSNNETVTKKLIVQ